MRLLSNDLERIAFYVQGEKGTFHTNRGHIASGKINAVERGTAYLRQKTPVIGICTDRWCQSILAERGIAGTRVLQGLFCLEEILELADLIAIGTNDLTQYILAADRDLTPDSDVITAMHPAVLRAIEQIVAAAQRWDCPVSVCGEEAGEPGVAESQNH